MNKLITLLLFASTLSYGAPVLNKNSSTTGSTVTIWPDHKDSNLFYYAPTQMNIALDENDRPRLNLINYNVGPCRWGLRCYQKTILSTYFESFYREEDLKNTKAKILSSNPKANFVPVPFISSRVIFGTTLFPFIDSHNCSPLGAQASDLVPCSIVLNYQGIHKLLPHLARGGVFAFNFTYKIYGVLETGTHLYKDLEVDYAIAINLGGEKLVGMPELEKYL